MKEFNMKGLNMKSIVFDAGPVISFTTNNLLWLLEKLKQKFKGNFIITSGVHYELIQRPLETKKFKFEALQVERLVEKEILNVIDDEKIKLKAEELSNLANNSLYAQGNPIQIVQNGEMETLAFAILKNPDAVVIDERITRLLVENPEDLRALMERRLHTKVSADKNKLKMFQELTRHISLIRSVELAAIGYELGFLDEYLVDVPNAKKELLESVLWGVKLNGCSVSEEEIKQIIDIELR